MEPVDDIFGVRTVTVKSPRVEGDPKAISCSKRKRGRKQKKDKQRDSRR